MKKASKIYIIIIVILVLALIGITSYVVIDKIKESNADETENIAKENQAEEQNNAQEEIEEVNKDEKVILSDNEYNVNDYVSFTDSSSTSNVKAIQFSNLPLRTTAEFYCKNNSFVTSLTPNDADYSSNTFTYETYKNILSVSTVEIQSFTSSPKDYYSINIDIDNQKPINNKQLLDIFNIKIEDVYTKILTNIANTVTAPYFLVDLEGDVTAEQVTIDEFRANISEYATYLNNNYDTLSLSIQNGKLVCTYWQIDILNLLGLGSHMGAGLIREVQVVELN